MVPGHPHTLCSDLSQLYGFSHICRNTRVSWESTEQEEKTTQKKSNNKVTCTETSISQFNHDDCLSHSLQHLPVLVVDQRQTPNSFEPLWHSPNACDSPRFSASAADLVGVSPLSRPKSVTHTKKKTQKFIRIEIPFNTHEIQFEILPALAIAAWNQLDFRDTLCGTPDTIHFHRFEFDASRSDKFDIHRCTDRNSNRPPPVVPYTMDIQRHRHCYYSVHSWWRAQMNNEWFGKCTKAIESNWILVIDVSRWLNNTESQLDIWLPNENWLWLLLLGFQIIQWTPIDWHWHLRLFWMENKEKSCWKESRKIGY